MTRRRGDAPSQRQLRVGEEIRHALVRMLARGSFRDPALDGLQVTITEVRMSPDLRNATAFVVPFAGGDAEAAVAALRRAAGYFRSRIAQEIAMRFTPSIRFTVDRTFESATRIDRLLHDPRVARDIDRTGRNDGDDGA